MRKFNRDRWLQRATTTIWRLHQRPLLSRYWTLAATRPSIMMTPRTTEWWESHPAATLPTHQVYCLKTNGPQPPYRKFGPSNFDEWSPNINHSRLLRVARLSIPIRPKTTRLRQSQRQISQPRALARLMYNPSCHLLRRHRWPIIGNTFVRSHLETSHSNQV